MAKMINRDSFIVESTEQHATLGAIDTGTVELTFGAETKRVKAYRMLGRIKTTSGVAGKYRTGEKVWKAYVSQREDGAEWVDFGRDDRAAKFKKAHFFFSDKF